MVKASFYYGYIALQICGGSLAEAIGTKVVLIFANGITALLALMSPWVANLGLWYFFALRLLQGIAESVTYPALPPLVNRFV